MKPLLNLLKAEEPVLQRSGVFLLASEFMTVYYSRHRSRVRVWGGGPWRSRLVEEMSFEGQNENARLLADLTRLSKAHTRLPCYVLLGASELRIGVVDGRGIAKSTSDWHALTTKRMILDFGLRVEDHAIAFEPFGGGREVIVIAAERSVVDALQFSAGSSVHVRCASAFALVAAHAALRRRSSFVMSLLEPGAVSVLTDAPYGSISQLHPEESPEMARSREVARVRMRPRGAQRSEPALISLTLDLAPVRTPQVGATGSAVRRVVNPWFLDLVCEQTA